jgi:REase_DpnII-MboI
MADVNKDVLREYLHWIVALLRSMEVSLRGEDPANVWKYGGYKQFARKYNQVATEIGKNVRLPPIVDLFDLEKMPGAGDTIAFQQKEIFEAVHANASVLRGFLESKIGIVEDETAALRDFFLARLRSAVFRIPEKEQEIQDAVEQLLIGRGLQKGEDYDREVGRVKVSVKEVIPDFILIKLGLALELKLVSRAGRVKDIVDEINADIAAYSKQYRSLLFIVYDVGHIRDELEFRQDLQRAGSVSVIVVKH